MDKTKIQILVLEEGVRAGSSIGASLRAEGYHVTLAASEAEAVSAASQKLFNVVIRAAASEHLHAARLMEKIRAGAPDTQFIFASGGGNVDAGVETMRKGAFDFLPLPLEKTRLLATVSGALEHQSLIAEDHQIKLRLRKRADPDIFAGSSATMGAISDLVRQIAPTDVTVLIEGESGTGKEVVARAIHEKSRRRGKAFVAVNCAGLPENLIEAELFGHVRGAFTGAISDRKGGFELARGGTLFLDEIGDLSAKGQGDLLRVLEDGTFRPVGAQRTERADVRVIAATNKNLELEAMQTGRFREDLYYRLNIVSIRIPPLRERVEDIGSLAKSFAEHFCLKHHRRAKRFTSGAIALFQTLRWPGNVRQLRNLVERLVVTVPRTSIDTGDLPETLHHTEKEPRVLKVLPGMTLARVEAELIRQTLLKVSSNRNLAAASLGISRRTLQYKIQRYHLQDL